MLKMMKAGRGAGGEKKEGGGYLDDRNKESLPPQGQRGNYRTLAVLYQNWHTPEGREIR